MFYNLCDEENQEHRDEFTKSYRNEHEAKFILSLYHTFLKLYPSYTAMSVVILTPYNEQKTLVCNHSINQSHLAWKPHRKPLQRNCPSSSGFHSRCLPRKRSWHDFLLNSAYRNCLWSGFCLWYSKNECQFYQTAVWLVCCWKWSEITNKQILESIYWIYEVGKERMNEWMRMI